MIQAAKDGQVPEHRKCRTNCKPRPARASAPSSVTRDILLHFDPEPLSTLLEMAQFSLSPNGWRRVSSGALATYAMGLIEVAIAEWREKQFAANLLKLDNTPMPAVGSDVKPSGRGRFSDEDKAKINEQRDAGAKIPELAERWGCGQTTIRRILDD